MAVFWAIETDSAIQHRNIPQYQGSAPPFSVNDKAPGTLYNSKLEAVLSYG
jgi:hypothetical protein